MNYIEKNSLKISQMTLGTVQLGMSYGVNNSTGMPSEEDSFKILDTAYENGITMLDTSDDYGKSEEVIGKYIKANPDKTADFIENALLSQLSIGKIKVSLNALCELGIISFKNYKYYLNEFNGKADLMSAPVLVKLNSLVKEGEL